MQDDLPGAVRIYDRLGDNYFGSMKEDFHARPSGSECQSSGTQLDTVFLGDGEMTDKFRVWMIRANDGAWAESFAGNGYIGLDQGMDRVDMSAVSTREEVRRLFIQEHPDETNERSIGIRSGQVANFHLTIKSGDFVLTPGFGDEVRTDRFIGDGSHYVSVDDSLLVVTEGEDMVKKTTKKERYSHEDVARWNHVVRSC